LILNIYLRFFEEYNNAEWMILTQDRLKYINVFRKITARFSERAAGGNTNDRAETARKSGSKAQTEKQNATQIQQAHL
jgi:hypothetical protein